MMIIIRKWPDYLNYSILSIVPQGDWRWSAKQVMFIINPINELERK